jgi:hypothetical protein
MTQNNPILKLEILAKCFVGWLLGKIGTVSDEVNYIGTFFHGKVHPWELRAKEIEYEPDRLFGFIPWDRQHDAKTFVISKKGDCNHWNRFWQVVSHNLGEKALLVTWIAHPNKAKHWWYWLIPPYWLFHWIAMSHGTCLINQGSYWEAYDYGDRTGPFESAQVAIKSLAKKYDCTVTSYAAQNINWKFEKI